MSGWDFGCQAVLSEPNLKEHLEQISKWNRSTACIFVLVFFPDKNQWNKSYIFLPFPTLLQQSVWSLAFGWIKILLVDMTLLRMQINMINTCFFPSTPILSLKCIMDIQIKYRSYCTGVELVTEQKTICSCYSLNLLFAQAVGWNKSLPSSGKWSANP